MFSPWKPGKGEKRPKKINRFATWKPLSSGTAESVSNWNWSGCLGQSGPGSSVSATDRATGSTFLYSSRRLRWYICRAFPLSVHSHIVKLSPFAM